MDYDGLGRLTGYADTGGQVRYGYNTANALTSITEPGGNCTGQTYTAPGAAASKCILIRVDDDGRRTGIRYPGGATQTWTLDGSGRPTQLKGTAAGTTRLDLTLSRIDPTIPATASNPNKDTGLITSITDAVTARTTGYRYDALDRLTTANTVPTAGGATTGYEAFCYDPAGNRTRYYTAAGATCTTTNPTQTLSYDAANQLTAATGTGLTGTGFSYDGNGTQTTAKSTPGARSPTTTATRPSPPPPPAPPRSPPATQPAATKTESPPGPPPSNPAPSPPHYYPFTDQVGAVRTMITNSGTVAAAYTYTAYGATKTATGTIATTNPYRYGAGYTDTTTGLINSAPATTTPPPAASPKPTPAAKKPTTTSTGPATPSTMLTRLEHFPSCWRPSLLP